MLKDRIASDNGRVFMNQGQFADSHTWNGVPFVCVMDETGSQRVSTPAAAGSAMGEATVYTVKAGFPGRAVVGESCFIDDRPYVIIRVDEDMGMYAIALCSNDARRMGDY